MNQIYYEKRVGMMRNENEAPDVRDCLKAYSRWLDAVLKERFPGLVRAAGYQIDGTDGRYILAVVFVEGRLSEKEYQALNTGFRVEQVPIMKHFNTLATYAFKDRVAMEVSKPDTSLEMRIT